MLLNSPAKPALAALSANSSAFALAAGLKLISGLASTAVAVRPLSSQDGTNARRGVRLTFFGTGADNATYTARIFVLRRCQKTGSDAVATHGLLRYWGSVAVTLSAAVGLANALIGASERIADTLVFTAGSTATTPKGICVTRETATGSPGTAAYSPADDTPAHLDIPDLGGEDELVIEFSTTGGGTATGMNALIEETV